MARSQYNTSVFPTTLSCFQLYSYQNCACYAVRFVSIVIVQIVVYLLKCKLGVCLFVCTISWEEFLVYLFDVAKGTRDLQGFRTTEALKY